MDLVGLLLIGAVLAFGSIYVAWIFWVTWREVCDNTQKTKPSGSVRRATTWLQHGLTLLVSLAFFSVAASLCFSIAQGDSCVTAIEQLKSLTAQESAVNGRPWGEDGNRGILHVTVSPEGERVTGASLAYIEFDNSDLTQLTERYPHIDWFILSGTQIDDRALRLLAERENLDALVLTDTSITDRGVAFFQGHRRLRELDVARTGITNQSLEVVGSLPALKHLTLRETDVTDYGLTALEGNTKLVTLSVHGTKISDAAIATLATLKSLERLSVSAHELSPDGLVQLQHALPGCQVIMESP